MANNGDLVNENDLSLKCHFDPTETSRFQSISNIRYKDIFYEIVSFIDKNNGRNGNGKNNSNKKSYLEYPKWCLDGNKPKCSDKENCEQCHSSKNKNGTASNCGVFSICSTIRRQIAVELLDRGQLQNCNSHSLYKTASKLSISDRLLIAESKKYKLAKNWFPNVYSLLIWQQEVVRILLHNLVYLNEWKLEEMKRDIVDTTGNGDQGIYDEEKDIECTTRGGGSMVYLQMQEGEFLCRFDVLSVLNSYLDELIEYLVLYYCCFDAQSWIGIFHPFIEHGIGSKLCTMLFDQSNKEHMNEAGVKSHFSQMVEADGNIAKKRACVQEMKAVCIFKRLLYDVYQRDNDQVNMGIATNRADENVKNAFNLTNQVRTKLKQTIDNIKTQLVLREMRINDNETDLEKEKYNQECKDDWVINYNDNMNQNDIIVPSFIRLFVIRRIIDKYIKNNKAKQDKKMKIKELSNTFKENKKIQSLVIDILTRLTNDGIKKYMSKWYNEKEQANIIEDIFNKIILKKFVQDYNEMNKSGINNLKTDNFYQHLVFNSSDLMTQIFQYLVWGRDFDEDLFSCSLVNSDWLYHAWDVNSVYHVDFSKLCEDDIIDNITKWTRIWQRLYNVKSVRFEFDPDDSEATARVNKLSMFKRVEKVNVYVGGIRVDECVSAVIAIMSKCKDRIKHCGIEIDPDKFDRDFEAPSALTLPKAQYVEIGDLLFHRLWTNECTLLKLSEVKRIKNDWCKFVIANCDCSNIAKLILNDVTFDDNSINEVILKQLALKFDNLKTLEIGINRKVDIYNNVLLFWQLLKPIISKNKTKVDLTIRHLGWHQPSLLSQQMDEKDLKIDKLIIGSVGYDVDGVIKLIQATDNRGLNQFAIEGEISSSTREKFLDQLVCKSITTFELKSGNMDFVNPLLEWLMIPQKQMLVIIDVVGNHNWYGSDAVLSLLKQLCQNLSQLFAQQIALDIKIKFTGVKDSSKYLSIYSSYFENKDFLSKYNKPKCNNNLYVRRSKPYTYFYIHNSQNEEWKRYFVFRATNVQIK